MWTTHDNYEISHMETWWETAPKADKADEKPDSQNTVTSTHEGGGQKGRALIVKWKPDRHCDGQHRCEHEAGPGSPQNGRAHKGLM